MQQEEGNEQRSKTGKRSRVDKKRAGEKKTEKMAKTTRHLGASRADI